MLRQVEKFVQDHMANVMEPGGKSEFHATAHPLSSCATGPGV